MLTRQATLSSWKTGRVISAACQSGRAVCSRGQNGALASGWRTTLASALLTVLYYHQPLEAGPQPMVDVQTGNRIVYNGEVYNYRELRAEL